MKTNKKNGSDEVVLGDDGVEVQVPESPPQPPPLTESQKREEEARAAGKRPLEEWAAAKGHAPGAPTYWKFASAVRLMGWTERHLVTEEEFDEAMKKFDAQVIR